MFSQHVQVSLIRLMKNKESLRILKLQRVKMTLADIQKELLFPF